MYLTLPYRTLPDLTLPGLPRYAEALIELIVLLLGVFPPGVEAHLRQPLMDGSSHLAAGGEPPTWHIDQLAVLMVRCRKGSNL